MLIALIFAAAAAAATPEGPIAGPAAVGGAPAPIAAPATTAETRSGPAGKAIADTVICRRQEETGSRLGGHKVCMTREQWADQEAAGKSLTDTFQQQAGFSPSH